MGKQSLVGSSWYFLLRQPLRVSIALFSSLEDRDAVYKNKGWFCQGASLFTLPWIPNFKPDVNLCRFYPHWISFPSFPLEYRDPDIVETMANQLGIFVAHNLIPFEIIQRDVRVCLLLASNKTLPKRLTISSKWGLWHQDIILDNTEVICKYQ